MTSFGQVLKEAGEFGLFQICLVLALCIPSLLGTFNMVAQIFTDLSFPHHCNTDWILERGPNLTQDRQRNLTLPVDKDGQFESCRMFVPVDWDLETIELNGINSTTECMDGWDYEVPEGASSVTTEFGLVCNNGGLIQASQSIFMAGFLVGSLVFGSLSDRFGRRFTILLVFSVLLLSGVGSALSPNIYVYMFFRFFYGSTEVLVGILCVLMVEWTDPSKAALCTTMIVLFGTLAMVLIPGIAYLLPNWRIMQLTIISPGLLVGLYYWLLPESPRWLLTQGKMEAAGKELQRAARVNRREIPEAVLGELEMETSLKRDNMLGLIKLSNLRKRTLILGFIWFSIQMVYYSLTLNVGSFGSNIYVTQVIFGTIELPSFLSSYFISQCVGRRTSQICFLVLAGAACLLILAVPEDLPVVVTVLAVFGKYSITSALNIIYIYTAELFPTSLRQNGMGVSLMFSCVGGILSPLVGLLEVYHPSIPMLICGTLPIVAGGLCFLLPETKNMELQDCAEIKKPEDGPTDVR